MIISSSHISVCDIVIPNVIIICHVMWVCPHISVSYIVIYTYCGILAEKNESIKVRENIERIVLIYI